MNRTPAVGQFAIRHRLAIAFITVALCIAGVYAALKTPSSVFPQTNFPRVVILVDNGVMPAEEMMDIVAAELILLERRGTLDQPEIIAFHDGLPEARF